MMLLKDQIISFLISFIYGFFLYFLIYRVRIYLFYKKRTFRIIFNAFFCIVSAFIYFLILFLFNNGIIHAYFFLFLIFVFLLSYHFCQNK